MSEVNPMVYLLIRDVADRSRSAASRFSRLEGILRGGEVMDADIKRRHIKRNLHGWIKSLADYLPDLLEDLQRLDDMLPEIPEDAATTGPSAIPPLRSRNSSSKRRGKRSDDNQGNAEKVSRRPSRDGSNNGS